MPPKGEKKTKEQIAAAAAAGGRSAKRKWSKAKNKEKLNHAVMFTQVTYDKIMNEVPKNKIITVSNLCERYGINGSLARQAIRIMADKKVIKMVGEHNHAQLIYTKAA